MICFKKYLTPSGDMLAMCDQDLIGKVLKEGKIYIDLDRYASYYKGEVLSEKDAAGRINAQEIRLSGFQTSGVASKEVIATYSDDFFSTITGVQVILNSNVSSIGNVIDMTVTSYSNRASSDSITA